MEINGIFESDTNTKKEEEKNWEDSCGNHGVARSSLSLTISQEKEATTHTSTPPIVSNATTSSDTFTNILPPTSAFTNNEISILSLMNQLSESYATSHNDFYCPSLLNDISGLARNNVSSSDFLLTSALLLTQIERQRQMDNQCKVSNTYSIFSGFQLLPDAQKDLITSTLSQHINLALEEQHRRSMDIYQQLQHRVNELKENYERIIDNF
ncbi:predicted protein [Chaetoceros tenuissimus]|uniref:Uncharacterized protein n=1 Tax=Chaetoceros tenuissimus TaxID=426638 RepID=A0AAD3DCA6_9STRA|nr:predicted protein [Chaetoceros tenuissimus]